jgi:hypothetical protein
LQSWVRLAGSQAESLSCAKLKSRTLPDLPLSLSMSCAVAAFCKVRSSIRNVTARHITACNHHPTTEKRQDVQQNHSTLQEKHTPVSKQRETASNTQQKTAYHSQTEPRVASATSQHGISQHAIITDNRKEDVQQNHSTLPEKHTTEAYGEEHSTQNRIEFAEPLQRGRARAQNSPACIPSCKRTHA